MPALDLAAKLLCERLLAVADGEDRNAALEDRLRRARAAGFRNRGRPAGEDDRLRPQPLERLRRLRERTDLTIDAGLPHPARDQLRHLGAEVDDEDDVVLHASRLAESVARRNGGGMGSRVRPASLHRIETLRAWIDDRVVSMRDSPLPAVLCQNERKAIVGLRTRDSVGRRERRSEERRV